MKHIFTSNRLVCHIVHIKHTEILKKLLVLIIFLMMFYKIAHANSILSISNDVSKNSLTDGTIIDQQAWKFSFNTRDEWFKFIAQDDGEKQVAIYSTMFDAASFDRYYSQKEVKAYRIKYMSEGLKINAFMVRPSRKGKYPVIIYNHGGVMQWGKIIFPEMLEFHRLAERGYIVLASYYRGEGGSEGLPDLGGGDVTDVLNLIKMAQTIPDADTSRIGMWGFSRGGGVAYGVLAKSNAIRAAVILGGPTDHVNSSRRAEFDEFVYPFAIRNYAADKDKALAAISSIRFVDKLAENTPIFLLHGAADVRVPATSSITMAHKLHELNRKYRLKIIENGSHGLFENYSDVRYEIDRWFDYYLKVSQD